MRFAILIVLLMFTLAADTDVRNTGISHHMDVSVETSGDTMDKSDRIYHVDELSVEELLSWSRWGNGYFGNIRDRAVQMTEDPHSDGIMLISPHSYGTEVELSYDVMTLRPATVLVAMLSISDGDGTGGLTVPAEFNGAMSDWPDGAVDYFFAFHNAPHFRHPFVVRRGQDRAELLEEADRTYMKVGQWHHVEVTRSEDRLSLSIDGETVLDVRDPNPFDEGHIAFRIRGSGTERASCFIKDVTIRTFR